MEEKKVYVAAFNDTCETTREDFSNATVGHLVRHVMEQLEPFLAEGAKVDFDLAITNLYDFPSGEMDHVVSGAYCGITTGDGRIKFSVLAKVAKEQGR